VSDYQIILLGNYAPARQPSMLRFAEMLRDGWHRRGRPVFLLQPDPWAGAHAPAGTLKWAGYVDYYLRFPPRILRQAALAGWNPGQPTVFHICDHSNSPYLRGLRGRHVALTCHDLLAVRGARGEPTYCHASRLGKVLQEIILRYLGRVPAVACDSSATRADFVRLTGRSHDPRVVVIPLALNAPFAPLDSAAAAARLARFPGLLEAPYVLHVGSGLERKNRAGVLRALALARRRWAGRAVFAGAPLTPAELTIARAFSLTKDCIVEIPDPTNDELSALYSRAHALVYPSYAEGYGWPVLEAQACGCPVTCSNATSLPEVAGSGALLHPPEDAHGFANDIMALTNPTLRQTQIRAGFTNAARLSADAMFDAYANLYEQTLAAPPA
jgi:glycosyltransferase involved in cell wall biosynthesis